MPSCTNQTLTLTIEVNLNKDTFDDLSGELDYGNYNHKTSHFLFGDIGLLLDPYYDLKITFYEDTVPDLIDQPTR